MRGEKREKCQEQEEIEVETSSKGERKGEMEVVDGV